MNQPLKGKLALAIQGAASDDAWTLRPIERVGSIHRLRWAKNLLNHDEFTLVVAPIFGPAAKAPDYVDPARVEFFSVGSAPKTGTWKREPVVQRPVIHAIEVLSSDAGGSTIGILTADNLGVGAVIVAEKRDGDGWTAHDVSAGARGSAPKRGSSEIHLGNLSSPHRRFFATIDPWHGTQVAISQTERMDFFKISERVVIDDTLDDGHALWVADVDGDGDDEVFAGHRGKDHRVSAYDFDGMRWNRTVLDREIAAQDLRGGDIDGDGVPDVVAIGGATHNVVWFKPIVTKR